MLFPVGLQFLVYCESFHKGTFCLIQIVQGIDSIKMKHSFCFYCPMSFDKGTKNRGFAMATLKVVQKSYKLERKKVISIFHNDWPSVLLVNRDTINMIWIIMLTSFPRLNPKTDKILKHSGNMCCKSRFVQTVLRNCESYPRWGLIGPSSGVAWKLGETLEVYTVLVLQVVRVSP